MEFQSLSEPVPCLLIKLEFNDQHREARPGAELWSEAALPQAGIQDFHRGLVLSGGRTHGAGIIPAEMMEKQEKEEEDGAHRAEDHVQRHRDVQVQGVVIDHADGEEHGHHDEIVPETRKNIQELCRKLPGMLGDPSGMLMACTERSGAERSPRLCHRDHPQWRNAKGIWVISQENSPFPLPPPQIPEIKSSLSTANSSLCKSLPCSLPGEDLMAVSH